jgi:hypothetical protein
MIAAAAASVVLDVVVRGSAIMPSFTDIVESACALACEP